jgi:hypothetical protein
MRLKDFSRRAFDRTLGNRSGVFLNKEPVVRNFVHEFIYCCCGSKMKDQETGF